MELRECLQMHLTKNLTMMIISGPKASVQSTKIKVRPVLLGGELKFQATEYIGTQVIHKNYGPEAAVEYLAGRIQNDFKQCQMEGNGKHTTILVSKKGKITIKTKQVGQRDLEESASSNGISAEGFSEAAREALLEHNKEKKYILKEGVKVPFLVDLGVMTKEGQIVRTRYDKFRQINRFLEFIEDIVPALPKDREITILDFGCGKSYLTFAVYYYLHELRQLPVHIIGLDLKKDVIAKCNRLAENYGYDRLSFLTGDIADYEGVNQVDMVITLHACDTATDYALAKAVKWGAKVILSVPCCQHEFNRRIENELLSPVLGYGILKERMAALMTDGIRAELLKEQGYKTDLLEFIDMEHTPKNLLIRGVYTGKKVSADKARNLMRELHVESTLMKELL